MAVPERVLVVGINYAPEHAGIAPYTTSLCEQLVQQGHEVHVLCGLPSYPSWRVPAEYRGRRRHRELVNGVSVQRLWHFVPRRQTALRRGLYEFSYGLHVSISRLPWKPDIVLAVVPSLLGARAASRIAERHGAEFAVWIQDMMAPAATQSGINGGAKVARITRRVERSVLASADRVAVIHEAFVSYVAALGVASDKVSIVKNWPHVAAPTKSRDYVRSLMNWPLETRVALHTGNMGTKQGLQNVVEAARLAEARGQDVRFVLMGDGSQRADLMKHATGVGNIEFQPPVPSEIYSDVLAAADVLLVNERGSVRDMSLPSKLTSYGTAGRPIIAAVRNDGATAREVSTYDQGIVVPPDDPEALLAAVQQLPHDVTALRAERGPGVLAAFEWTLCQESTPAVTA